MHPCTPPPQQQFLEPVGEDPGDPWPPDFEEEGRAALAEFMKVYEPELADEATSKAIEESMAAGEWVEEEEEEDVGEDEPAIPDLDTMAAEELSRFVGVASTTHAVVGLWSSHSAGRHL